MNSIHPTAIIVGDIDLGRDNVIGPHVVIYGPARIGDQNWFGAGAVVGAAPEVRGLSIGAESATSVDAGGVVIGHRNVIREAAQIHRGWQSSTTIGDDAYVMNQSYIAHDCILGDGVTLASSVLLAGHVQVGSGANLGLGTTVHQRRQVGVGSMVGMSAVVTRDLPPFAKAYGNPARVSGVNVVGMQRAGVSDAVIQRIAGAYALDASDARLLDFRTDVEVGAVISAWLDR